MNRKHKLFISSKLKVLGRYGIVAAQVNKQAGIL